MLETTAGSQGVLKHAIIDVVECYKPTLGVVMSVVQSTLWPVSLITQSVAPGFTLVHAAIESSLLVVMCISKACS